MDFEVEDGKISFRERHIQIQIDLFSFPKVGHGDDILL
jgi:hypothetical protein